MFTIHPQTCNTDIYCFILFYRYSIQKYSYRTDTLIHFLSQFSLHADISSQCFHRASLHVLSVPQLRVFEGDSQAKTDASKHSDAGHVTSGSGASTVLVEVS